jgi:uracil-DNA glycosylase
MFESSLPEHWREAVVPFLATAKARALTDFLRAEEVAGKTIYPPPEQRFAALERTPLESVKVVILGQDPYHGPGQAQGLSFSVPDGIAIPPSLRNIYKERETDLGIPPAPHGNLSRWADQGVLLLNTALTVAAGQAGSHQRRGWEEFTDAVVAAVAAREAPSVFVLWGAHAQKQAARVPGLVRGSPHLVLTSAHPSPLSAYVGFFGSKPFSQANAFLKANGRGVIDWRV